MVPWPVVKGHPRPLMQPPQIRYSPRWWSSVGWLDGHDFITVFSSAAVWPVAARAQQTRLPVVGVLNAGLADASANNVGARKATRVPTATWTSRVLGDRATLSKTGNSGKVASELRIGRIRVKDWALTT
jgi:hypothetical protein